MKTSITVRIARSASCLSVHCQSVCLLFVCLSVLSYIYVYINLGGRVPVFSPSRSRGRTGGCRDALSHATRVARDDGGARVGARASEGRLAQAEGGERPCCRLSLQAGHVEQPAATRSRSRAGSLRCRAQSARRGVQCFGARLALRGLVGAPPARRGLLRQRPLPLSAQAARRRQGRRARARALEAGGSAEALEGRERPQPDRPPNDPHAPRARSTPSGAAPRGGSTCGVARGRPARGGLLAREQDVACRRREGGRAVSRCRVLRGAVRHARCPHRELPLTRQLQP